MVLGGSLVKTFQKPPWESAADVDAFLAAQNRISKSDIVKAFDAATRLYGQVTQKKYGLVCMALIGLVQRAPSPDLFTPLVRTLKRPNRFLLETLSHVLPLVNNPKEHIELVAFLGAERKEVREAAAAYLSHLYSATTLTAITAAIKKRGFSGAGLALQVAVNKSGARAMSLLDVLTKSSRADDRVSAAQCLSTDGLMLTARDEVMRLLAGLNRDPDATVAKTAFQSFGRVCTEDEFFDAAPMLLERQEVAIDRAVIRVAGRFKSERIIKLLERAYAAGPDTNRIIVLQALESIADDATLPIVVEAMEAEDLKVQSEAVRVLKAMTASGQIDAARAVIWLLKSDDVRVRRMASEVTASIKGGRDEIWPRLVRFLRDQDWWVRERVLDGLVDIAGEALLPTLVQMLDDEAAAVRRIAVEGIARLGHPQGLGAVIRQVKRDDDWWTREEAVRAAGAIGDARAVPHVIGFLKADIGLEVAAIDALIALEARSAAEDVLALTSAPDGDIRLAALRFFEMLDDPQYSQHLMALAFDDDIEVLERARGMLNKWNVRLDAEEGSEDEDALGTLLAMLVEKDGDDLFIIGGRRIFMKQRGQMIPLTDDALTVDESYRLLTPMLSPEHLEDLSNNRDVDMSLQSSRAASRFRVNIFQSADGLGAVFRKIVNEVMAFEKLHLPAIVQTFSSFKNGLVLVGGPPGSGKSTTLGALIDLINRREARHIITVEDPIEGVQRSIKSIINQREVGTHTRTFHGALRSILRQDPDVILIGELRDPESISFALQAAETGHLVLGTVHTFAADTTVERLINSFPANKRDMARNMLSENLRAVLCQLLLESRDGGRALATEIMVVNDAIRNIIRKNQAQQIPSMIALAQEQGMIGMDMSLRAHYDAGNISEETLYARLRNKDAYEHITKQPDPVKAEVGQHDELGQGEYGAD